MPTKPIANLCPGCDQPMLPKGMKKKPMQYDHAQGCPLDPKAKRKPVPSDTERLDWLQSVAQRWVKDMFAAECGFEVSDDGDVMSGCFGTRLGDYNYRTVRDAIDAAMRAARRKR